MGSYTYTWDPRAVTPAVHLDTKHTVASLPRPSHLAIPSLPPSRTQIKSASRLAGISTASIGKFDKRLKGEKPGERTPLGKRRNFASVTDTKSERTKMGG